MSHLLTEGQTKQRVKIAKQMLKILPKFDEKIFANVATSDETWVLYFKPFRKVSNKIWATNSNNPVIAKCTISAKNILYAIFISGEGVVIEVPVKRANALLENTKKLWY